jgi:two-component system, chemotaxis family, CheB/CheR fusion protein
MEKQSSPSFNINPSTIASAPMPNTPNLDPTSAANDLKKTGEERKPRVLVVDDAPDVTHMLAVLLQYAGYEVVTVFSAFDALNAARTEQFDVIVSDIGMPGMSGYELAKELRNMANYHKVLMIAITGFSMYDDRERAIQSGFNAFLTKPINPTALTDLIKRLNSNS